MYKEQEYDYIHVKIIFDFLNLCI